MFCKQMQLYLTYIIVQTIFSLVVFGPIKLQIFGPLVFLCILYLLCNYKQFKIANILVGLTIFLGVTVDIYSLLNRKAVHRALLIQTEHRDIVRGL